MKKLFLITFLLAFLYIAARVMLVWDTPNSDDASRVSVKIDTGTTLDGISSLLGEKGIIADPLVFRWFVKWQGLGNKLQAGEYLFQKNLTFKEVVEILQDGRSSQIKVTIPEGSTIAQIDTILAKKALIDPGAFKTCAATCNLSHLQAGKEGYLFPSTYFVQVDGFTSKKFLNRLHENFRIRVEPFGSELLESGRTLDEVVKVASMVEREAFGNGLEEKRKISGVIWARLDEGIALGIDATTRYELNEWKRPLYTEDFETNSPYNTRRVKGLPPTAIANFSESSYEAAVSPIKTPYRYYLHDCAGKIHFAEGNDGHVRNKQSVNLSGRDC